MIHVSCPSCQAPYDLDERRMPASGMRMRCPKCGSSFQVLPTGVTTATAPAGAPPAAPKRAPLAPAFPSDDLDLPAPKSAAGALDVDLPAPKPKIAPVFDELDLPAPKGPAVPGALDELDLPAPKPAAAKGAFGELDLPAPKPKGPPALGAFGELDLPAPKPKIAPAFGELDLPAPKAAPGIDLDLPAPKRGAAPAGIDLDLPAPKRGAAPAGIDLDLPAPKRGAAPVDLDLDLPAPKGGAFPDLDLPAPKSAAARDALDLPSPKRGGGGGFDLDLPIPKVGGGVDLPAPKLGADLPAPKLSADLPAPKLGASLDLPAAKGAGDLPVPKAGPGVPKGPPPPPRAAPPVPRAAPPAASEVSFGELDLGAPPAKTRGAALGDFEDDLAAPTGGGGLDLGLDLELPRARPRGAAPAERRSGGALFSEPPPGEGSDDLALPAARPRGGDVTADGRPGAGGAAFGELDLGGDDPGVGEDLEFGGIPQSSGPASLPGLDDAPLVVQSAEKSQAAKREESKAQQAALRKRRFARALATILVLAVALGGAGFALRFTEHGTFGIFFIERFFPAAKGGEVARSAITRADRAALDDTYAGSREALATLGAARRRFGLDRTLLVRSLLHESLYLARFGDDSASANRVNRIVARLDERSNDAPGIELALAANELRRGNVAGASAHLSRARSSAASDPFFDVIDGEIALASGRYPQALAAFNRAKAHGGRGRAAWGVARASIAMQTPDAAAAIDATLAASPEHVEARVAKARVVLEGGALEEALALARVAAGLDPLEGRRLRGGPLARADALVLVGAIEERRGHRAEARVAYEAAVRLDGYELDALVGAGRVLMLESSPREALVRLEAAIQVAERQQASNDAERARVAARLAEARLLAVQALLALERAQDAVAIVRALLTAEPERAEVFLAQGRVAEALRETELAETSYRSAIEKAPTSFDAYLALSQLYFALERPDDAARVLADAASRVEVTAAVRRAKGEVELRRNNLALAITEFRGALELDPNDRASLFGLGVAQRRTGELAAAQATFDKLASIDATYPGLALERGQVFEARGDAAEAVRAYTRALADRPDDYELMTRLAGAQVAAGLLDDAEVSLRKVLEHEPGNALALHYSGRAQFLRGRVRESIPLLSRAIALDPSRAEFRVYLAWAHLEDNDLGAAQAQVTAALERDPTLGDAYFLRARLLARTGRAQEGLLDAAQALQRNPNRVEVWAVIGDCQEQLGRRADAIAAYQQATRARPQVAEWWYELGRLELDSGRAADAAGALARAAELGDAATQKPGWLPDAHRALGDVLAARGDRAGAIRHYQRYLEIAPPSSIDRQEVQRALSALGG